ncbi:GNAT family N-acetyltransferase [uncultured Meiothermus sp.]|jgi:ribosomal protein S18 acetylase RimI-like enzyme|uniref:GNAT family N-acetyltransferase n=1 Tax=uncultured Meiothermus sp. TaxID=157471 RepID=UPI002604E60F|nr:GNAT family N-acetyltransferase [uncultured Meiothermus sp.]
MTINLVVRPFEERDYAAIAEVFNAAWPDQAHTETALREDDDHAPQIKWGRFVAEIDHRIVGVGEYTQFEGMYHPQRFAAWVTVRPEFRSQGIGKALYRQVVAALEPHDPISILSSTREDQTAAIAWLHKLGYLEKMKYWESRLDVQAFDFAPYAGKIEAAEAAGFELKCLKELESDPEYQQKSYDLWLEARLDVPRPDAISEVGFEDYCKWVFGSSYYLPEAYFVAVDTKTGQYVAMSTLWKSDGDYLGTGLTGTRRAYRRLGLALALKLKGIRFARERGVKEIRTGNESNNRAMLSINEAMGFVKQPIWADYVLTIKEEAAMPAATLATAREES